MSRWPTYLAAAAVVALIAAGAAWGTAQLTGEGTLRACAQKSEGILRLVGAEGQCRDSEVAVEWNVVGPQGPTGPPGPAGAVGAYAHVFANGTLGTARGVASVTTTIVPGTVVEGLPGCCPVIAYCIRLEQPAHIVHATGETKVTHVIPPPPPPIGTLPPTPTTFVGSPSISVTLDAATLAELGCSAGTDAAATAPGLAGASFYVSFA